MSCWRYVDHWHRVSCLKCINRARPQTYICSELLLTLLPVNPWHQRPASSAVAGRQQLRHPEVQAISGRDRRESEAIFRCHENTTVAGDEKRRQVVDDLAARNSSRWRDERVRARDKAMLQMYNRCEADMGTAVATLRESLHHCSIVSRVRSLVHVFVVLPHPKVSCASVVQ